MGTHISKVKSVDLDAWTDEQVESMVKWGNAKCNAYWEAKLPANYTPDQSKIENFIRTKYDLKKWVASATIPNPAAITQTQASAAVASTPISTSAPTTLANLLDDDFGAFTQLPTPPKATKDPVSTPVQATRAPLQAAARTKAQLPTLPVQPQLAQSTGGSLKNNGRNDLKKSILSLYLSPLSSSSSFIQPQRTEPLPQSTNVNNLSSSLADLNFGTPQPQTTQQQVKTPTPAQNQTPTYNPPAASATPASSSTSSSFLSNIPGTSFGQTEWSNEWSGTLTVKLNKLDDDLFKNVWD